MALKTDITSNECYDFSSILENGQLVLLNQPLMFCSQDSSQNHCSIGIEQDSTRSSFNQNLNYPEIIFNRNYIEIKDAYMHEENRIDDGLEVLQILCNESISCDQPEFVDINDLTENETNSEVLQETSVISVSDDDDVVFVKEYKEIDQRNIESPVKNVIEKKNSDNVRRNPIRSVRTKSRDLSKELLFEEDFAFLDVISEDEDEKDNKVLRVSNDTSSAIPKQWPINAHERPEYNCVTNKIDSFDYTIRDIQKTVPVETKAAKVAVRKKPKKKYLPRKRKARAIVQTKHYLDELKPIIDSTTEMLKQFFIDSKERGEFFGTKSDICSSDNKLEVLKNQAILFSLVNDIDESGVMEKLKYSYVNDKTSEFVKET